MKLYMPTLHIISITIYLLKLFKDIYMYHCLNIKKKTFIGLNLYFATHLILINKSKICFKNYILFCLILKLLSAFS